MRLLTTLPLLVLLSVVPPLDPAQVEAAHRTATSRRADLVWALEVLHRWDARRADAWAESDATALRALYLPGSGAARADLRLLGAYRARGLVVRRIETQVFAIRVLHVDASAMRLRVFDRVAGGEVVEDGHAGALPSSRPVTRDIELRLGSRGWRVASVSDSGRGPHAARR